MTRKSTSKKSRIAPPDGLTTVIRQKSGNRREMQRTLTTLQHGHTVRNDLLPTLTVKYISPSSLQSAKRRVRKSDPAQSARLDRSIGQFGICVPILIDEENHVVQGHEVWQAACRAGLETVPVIEISHLDEAGRRSLSIALNRLAETGMELWSELGDGTDQAAC